MLKFTKIIYNLNATLINIGMAYCLPIEDHDARLSLYYLKATHYLVSNNLSSNIDTEILWKQQFNAAVDFKQKLIIFDKEYDKTLFLLQWS
jgi:hypothetical protein